MGRNRGAKYPRRPRQNDNRVGYAACLAESGPAPGESLVRAIGTLGLAAGIINITIGGGIFRLPALVAASLGPAAPLAYLVARWPSA